MGDGARTGRKASTESVLRLAEGLMKGGRYEEAIAPLTEAARLVPQHHAIAHDLGMAYLRTGRLPEAVASLRRAIALRPDFAPSHHSLARVAELLLRQGRPGEAAAAFEAAAAAAPGTTFGRMCTAKGLLGRNRTAEATEALRDLVAHDPSSAEAHLALGQLMNEAGRFDEATASFERSIAAAPRQAAAYQGLVASRRLTEADRPLVARILARLEDGSVADPQRMTLHFAAGKALDDLRDHAGAIAQFDAANRLRRKLAPPFDRAYLEQRVSRLVARYTRDFFARHAAMGRPDATPVLVLGMPRSGTTLVERILSSHPRVGGGGELVYWNERAPAWVDAPEEALAGAAEGLRGDYLQLLRAIAPDALRVTDKMPFNFLWIGLVHLLLPDARILHCRRNPIDTCLSIYTTQFVNNWGYASDRGDLALYYRQYLRLMEHWRAVLPADRLLDVDYEEATAEPEATARRLVAFCGLEWDDACLRPEQNPDAVRTANKWHARQPVYRTSVDRWRKYEPWLGELRGLLP